jgi:transcriptional regulator
MLGSNMSDRTDVLQGTLALMVLKTLDTLGPRHGYGIARRIEQQSGDTLHLNQGTLYPMLVKLEQQGWIRAKWGASENNRRAKFYSLTRAAARQLTAETNRWARVSALVGRILEAGGSS